MNGGMDDFYVYVRNKSFMLLMYYLIRNLYVHFGSGEVAISVAYPQ